MKRVVALLIALLMLLAMTSCGKGGVEKALQEGVWKYEDTAFGEVNFSQSYEFMDEGKVSFLFKIPMESVDYKTYTYEIVDEDTIVVHRDGDDDFDFTYAYENGVLRLFKDEAKEYELRNEK